MGLDQYAYARSHDQNPEDVEPAFVWRKHAKLQTWAENLFEEKTGQSAIDLNCNELALDAEGISNLKAMIKAGDLPESSGGFFYGHQFQIEAAKEYREQDLEFCDWALAQLKDGQSVYYSCWW